MSDDDNTQDGTNEKPEVIRAVNHILSLGDRRKNKTEEEAVMKLGDYDPSAIALPADQVGSFTFKPGRSHVYLPLKVKLCEKYKTKPYGEASVFDVLEERYSKHAMENMVLPLYAASIDDVMPIHPFKTQLVSTGLIIDKDQLYSIEKWVTYPTLPIQCAALIQNVRYIDETTPVLYGGPFYVNDVNEISVRLFNPTMGQMRITPMEEIATLTLTMHSNIQLLIGNPTHG